MEATVAAVSGPIRNVHASELSLGRLAVPIQIRRQSVDTPGLSPEWPTEGDQHTTQHRRTPSRTNLLYVATVRQRNLRTDTEGFEIGPELAVDQLVGG